VARALVVGEYKIDRGYDHMSEEPVIIRIKTQTAKFTTLVDGTRRIYLDLIDADSDAIIAILATQAPGVMVEWAGVPIMFIVDAPVKQKENRENAAIPARSEWQP
jgi:hypothetical protein